MLCFSMRAKKAKKGGKSLENLSSAPREYRPCLGDPLKPCHRIAMLGAPGVGKTAICEKLQADRKQDHFEVTEEVDEELMTLNIAVATAVFPSRYKNVSLRSAVMEAEGYILVYSITERRSLATIHQLVSYIRYIKKDKDLPVVLVGNKMDASLERCISQEEGRHLAFDLGVSFYETTTRLTPDHVTKIVHDLVRQLRCVRIRRDFEREQDCHRQGECSALCGSRGLVERLSFRAKNRQKLLIKTRATSS